MPRQARESSGTGIYHVMMRGINHQNIFEEQEDYYQFLNTLDKGSTSTGSSVSIFCMPYEKLHINSSRN